MVIARPDALMALRRRYPHAWRLQSRRFAVSSAGRRHDFRVETPPFQLPGGWNSEWGE
jgi:hypothetical protein